MIPLTILIIAPVIIRIFDESISDILIISNVFFRIIVFIGGFVGVALSLFELLVIFWAAIIGYLDAVTLPESKALSMRLGNSYLSILFLFIAEVDLWFLDYYGWLFYVIIIIGILDYMLFFVLVISIVSGNTKLKDENSKTKMLFVISMFLLLWFILTVIVCAAMPEKPFYGLTYYGTLDNWNFVRNVGNAAYFVLITITTVGYGEIIPSNWFGKILVILIILSGLFFLSVFVSVFTSTGQSENKKTADLDSSEMAAADNEKPLTQTPSSLSDEKSDSKEKISLRSKRRSR